MMDRWRNQPAPCRAGTLPVGPAVRGSVRRAMMTRRRTGLGRAAGASGAAASGPAGLGTRAGRRAIGAGGSVRRGRTAPADEQALMRRLAEPLPGLTDGNRRSGTVLRLSFAALLLAGGLIALLSGNESIA